MKCERKNCRCSVTEGKEYVLNGKVYCDKICATSCTEDKCVCTPCDCEKK